MSAKLAASCVNTLSSGLEVPQSRNSTNRFDTKQFVMTLQDRHRRGVDLIQRDSVAQERRYLLKSSRAEQVVGTHTIARRLSSGVVTG